METKFVKGINDWKPLSLSVCLCVSLCVCVDVNTRPVNNKLLTARKLIISHSKLSNQRAERAPQTGRTVAKYTTKQNTKKKKKKTIYKTENEMNRAQISRVSASTSASV